MARAGINNLVEFAEAFYKAQASRDIKQDWQLISNIFNVHVSKGHMYVPKAFYPKIKKWFGKLDDYGAEDAVLRVENQVCFKEFCYSIIVKVRIVNKWTFTQTLFNPLRSHRPMNNNLEHKSLTEVADALEEIPEKCDFCSPLSYTGIDVWGRIERDTCMTASNCAKYDVQHGLIIFKDHSPLKYTKEKLNDIFTICDEWFSRANEANSEAIYPMLSWNCKGRAGASQNHGHCHLLLGEQFHYGKWEYFKNCAVQYNLANPGQNYFQDLVRASRALGLVKTIGNAYILINLTPTFGHDLIVIGWNFDRDFRDAMHSAIKTLITRFKSLTFNIGIHFPPLENGRIRKKFEYMSLQERLKEKDAPMPFLGYLVDRGEQSNGKYTSDVCGMILNGSNMVSLDPFELGSILRVPDQLWE